jgi:hypothetical protein
MLITYKQIQPSLTFAAEAEAPYVTTEGLSKYYRQLLD